MKLMRFQKEEDTNGIAINKTIKKNIHLFYTHYLIGYLLNPFFLDAFNFIKDENYYVADSYSMDSQSGEME